MVLPEPETQRPSFPPFAYQFDEVERIQAQNRVAAYFHNDNRVLIDPASSTNREPLTIRNINPPTPDFPLLPSPILQERMDTAPSTAQEPTPGLHRPDRLSSTTPYADDILLRRRPPPHLRIGIPSEVPNPSDHNSTFPAPRTSHLHSQSQSPHPLPNGLYLPSRPAPLPPSVPPSSSSSSPFLRALPRLFPLTIPVPPSPSPSPPGQLISLYALRVRPGDILAYGNKLNHGCTVTACYPDERRPDLVPRRVDERHEGDGEDDEGDVGGPVKLNGGVRIRWRDGETGEELSQLFEGLEVLMVRRREEGGSGEEEEVEEEGYNL